VRWPRWRRAKLNRHPGRGYGSRELATAAITIAILSLSVSAVTAWLTLFRRGTVRMTQPTVIFFGPDTSRPWGLLSLPKVYLRTLLFATSKRGRVIESMHVGLSRNETHQNFNIWVYGERGQLVRGSGLFVGETGIAANHHFLLPPQSGSFQFTEGHYRLDVFARLLGDDEAKLLFTQELTISREISARSRERSRRRWRSPRQASTSTGVQTPRATSCTWIDGSRNPILGLRLRQVPRPKCRRSTGASTGPMGVPSGSLTEIAPSGPVTRRFGVGPPTCQQGHSRVGSLRFASSALRRGRRQACRGSCPRSGRERAPRARGRSRPRSRRWHACGRGRDPRAPSCRRPT
jgi:hypothetical protein